MRNALARRDLDITNADAVRRQPVEVLRDRAVALPPLNETLARDLVAQTRISRLLARGDVPVSFQRRFAPALAALGIEQRLGDLADASAVHAACEGVDAVLHNAAKAGAWGSRAAPMPLAP